MLDNGKAKINNTAGNYTVSIPSKKSWFALVFGTVWMFGWYMGFSTATNLSGTNDTGIDTFIAVWLVMWCFGGLFVVSMLLWGFFGKETIEFRSQNVLLSKTVFGIGIKKTLVKHEVKNFRFEKINESIFGGSKWAVWGVGPGKVKFDYGFKTYSFGLALDDAEANYLSDELNKKCSNTNYSS